MKPANRANAPTRVLLADDHAVVRDGLRALIEAQGGMTVVASAGTGSEAVRDARKHNPDIAVLDIAMPELNGIEAAQKIRECCPDTSVVILSMYGTADHVSRALHAGVAGFVLKRSASGELVNALKSARNGHPYLCSRITKVLIDEFLARSGSAGNSSPLARLSAREREIVQLIAEGHSCADIAAKLYLSPKTVYTYRRRVMAKLDVPDVTALIRFAVAHGRQRIPVAAIHPDTQHTRFAVPGPVIDVWQ